MNATLEPCLEHFNVCICTNVSSDVELQRGWVLKSKMFSQESTYSKEIIIFREYKVTKTFQSRFYTSKIDGLFFHLKTSIHFLVGIFFSNSNFWIILFSKIMPNFWRAFVFTKYNRFFWVSRYAFFYHKPCFLWPTLFKIPQPNYHLILYRPGPDST